MYGHPRMHVNTEYTASGILEWPPTAAKKLHHMRLATKQKQIPGAKSILDLKDNLAVID